MTNLVLLTVDCLRADRLGCLGYQRALSPHIDRLAGGSALFSRAFATGPRTTESFPAILASTYPLAFGGTFTLPEHLRTLAEVLAQQGYATAAFHSNPFLLSEFGYGRGFAHYWDAHEATAMSSKVGARVMPRLREDSRLYRLLRRLVRYFEAGAGVSYYVRAEEVNRRALQWLAEAAEPFFLWVHYMDMHYPFSPPERCIRQVRPGGIPRRQQARLMVRTLEDPATVTEAEAEAYRDLYDAGLLYVDESVGALLRALDGMDLLKDAVLMLTADHGEEFREHGDFGHGLQIHVPGADSVRIKLYDELLHVPLLVRAPGAGVRPGRIDALASLVDLGPTFLDLMGLEPVESWHGMSLAPLLRGEGAALREETYSEYAIRREGPWQAVVSCRTARWKYIHDGAFGRHELYDLHADPAEQDNLYGSSVPVLFELQEKIRQHLSLAHSSSAPAAEVEVDPEVAERLRGLGYLD
ncbi:MAG TPA: sulfatase [Anaerolineae bacterium]|nr:sulfatase [Anaerolineae bacterium]